MTITPTGTLMTTHSKHIDVNMELVPPGKEFHKILFLWEFISIHPVEHL